MSDGWHWLPKKLLFLKIHALNGEIWEEGERGGKREFKKQFSIYPTVWWTHRSWSRKLGSLSWSMQVIRCSALQVKDFGKPREEKNILICGCWLCISDGRAQVLAEQTLFLIWTHSLHIWNCKKWDGLQICLQIQLRFKLIECSGFYFKPNQLLL